MTKEERRIYNKKYKEANKKRLAEAKKDYYNNNKESFRLRELKTKHKPCVYILPFENYIGTTENYTKRIINHTAKGKNVNSARVLKYLNNRAEALELEQLLHSLGYEGKHNRNTYK